MERVCGFYLNQREKIEIKAKMGVNMKKVKKERKKVEFCWETIICQL